MKIGAKIIIIIVENREHYYFIIIYKYKEVCYPYSLIRCLLQLLTLMSGLVTIRFMQKPIDILSNTSYITHKPSLRSAAFVMPFLQESFNS